MRGCDSTFWEWALTLTCLPRGKGTGMLVGKLEFNP